MTATFLRNTRAEFLKCNNTAAFWITLAGAGFIPFVNMLKCLLHADYFAPKLVDNPWTIYLEYNWQIAAGFLLTMYVILVTSLLVQIEYRNNAWKQVYTSPRTYFDIYFSKFLMLNFLVIICFVLFNIFTLVFGYVISIFDNRYSFFSHSVPWTAMITTSWKMYVSVLAMSAIQFGVATKFSNFALPLGIGLGLFTLGFMIRQWEGIAYYPYLYPFLVYFNNPGLPENIAGKSLINSFLWSLLALFLGYHSTKQRLVKG
ncbi:MAG TPA: ABC transporter permease [Chryseolinea sp.]